MIVTGIGIRILADGCRHGRSLSHDGNAARPWWGRVSTPATSGGTDEPDEGRGERLMSAMRIVRADSAWGGGGRVSVGVCLRRWEVWWGPDFTPCGGWCNVLRAGSEWPVRPMRGCGAAGSASHWQCEGQGFESPHLHNIEKPVWFRCFGGAGGFFDMRVLILVWRNSASPPEDHHTRERPCAHIPTALSVLSMRVDERPMLAAESRTDRPVMVEEVEPDWMPPRSTADPGQWRLCVLIRLGWEWGVGRRWWSTGHCRTPRSECGSEGPLGAAVRS